MPQPYTKPSNIGQVLYSMHLTACYASSHLCNYFVLELFGLRSNRITTLYRILVTQFMRHRSSQERKRKQPQRNLCVCVFYEALSKVLSERRKGALFRRTTTPEEFTECVMMTNVLRLVVFQIWTLKETHWGCLFSFWVFLIEIHQSGVRTPRSSLFTLNNVFIVCE